jgi:hypothetical protein
MGGSYQFSGRCHGDSPGVRGATRPCPPDLGNFISTGLSNPVGLAFSPIEQADIAATSLTINGGQASYGWSISGANLSTDPTVKLYWSDNGTFEAGIDREANTLITAGDRAVVACDSCIVNSRATSLA